MSKSGLAYIRDYYRVPAYLDVRVRLEDGRWAEIVGSEGAYLEVFVDGARTKSIVHPNGCGYRPEGTSQRVDELVAERRVIDAAKEWRVVDREYTRGYARLSVVEAALREAVDTLAAAEVARMGEATE